MDKTLQIACINYLNSMPFVYAIEKLRKSTNVELLNIIPSATATHFKNHHSDIALVPVAALLELDNYRIISDYCISCDGTVSTVSIFSNDPIEEVEHIFLDNHSKTSNKLVQLLVRDFWKRNITYSVGDVKEQALNQGQAKLMIGDKVLESTSSYKYEYDLGEYWKKHTGLPFVFAVWIARTGVDDRFVQKFNEHIKESLDNIDIIIEQMSTENNLQINYKKYLKEYIQYTLSPEKRQAISLFLESISKNVLLT